MASSADHGNRYRCLKCGFTLDEDPRIWKCPKCGYILDLVYEYGDTLPEYKELFRCSRGIWCFSNQIPRYSSTYSLGEGLTRTRVIRIDNLDIVAKLELYNPTGSFKDRGTAVAISMVKNLVSGNSIKVVEDSSGNAGLSTSCYATYTGLTPVIVVPRTAPRGKINAIELCGGNIIVAHNRDHASEVARELADREGYIYLPHTWLPHFVEGMKTIAYELYLEHGEELTHIFIPSSSGSALIGVYRGYLDLYRWGYIASVPKIIAVQNTYAYPLYRLAKNREPEIVEEQTLADGVSLKNPPRLHEMKKVIENSGGDVIVVSNSEIRHSVKTLIAQGILPEPTSASALAGLIKYSVYVEKPDRPAILITGSGLKMIDTLKQIAT